MSERPKYEPPALPDFREYDPQPGAAMRAMKARQRMTSNYQMVDLLEAYKQGRCTANEVVEYLRLEGDRSIFGAIEYGQRHPEYVTPLAL